MTDLADLDVFWSDYWLWIACWKADEIIESMAMSGGSELLMAESTFLSIETTALETAPVEEKSTEEQILELEDCIEFLEQLWLEDPTIRQEINAGDWQKFMDSVYQSLLELQTESTQVQME